MLPVLLVLATAGAVVAVAALAPERDEGVPRVAFSQVEVQAFLEREVARTLPGLNVGAASCPSELPREAGGTAACTVTVERDVLRYEVQRLVGDRFEARPEHPVVLVRDLAGAVRSKLAAADAQVACGAAAVLQPVPGRPLTCQVTGGGVAPRTVAVAVGPDGAVSVTDA